MKKRLTALLLALLMLSALLPFGAFAEGEGEETVPEELTENNEPTTGTEPSDTEELPTEDENSTSSEEPEEIENNGAVEDGEDPVKPDTEPSAPPEVTTEAEGEPERSEEELPDGETLKAQFFLCKSLEEAESFLAALSEEQQTALFAAVTEAELRAWGHEIGLDRTEQVITPAVNYAEAGPLMPAVKVRAKKMMLAAGAGSSDTGLELSKAAVDNGDGTYTVTLETYTTGTVKDISASVPVDIVLVLDESGSMDDRIKQYTPVYSLNTNNTYYAKVGDNYIQVNYCTERIWLGIIPIGRCSGWYSGAHFLLHWGTEYEPRTSATDSNTDHVQFYTQSNGTETKRAALKAAAIEFAEKVYEDAVTNDVDHRMAVVGFSDTGRIRIGLEDDIRDNLSSVETAINALQASGGTYINSGMSSAASVFDNAAATTAGTRKRVVIVFTDGIPGSGSWSTSNINNSANPAIATSYQLKNSYGATVYSIGMMDDVNPELEISTETSDAARTNRFLHYLSSNYPNATTLDNGGSGGGNNGYYLSASDTGSLLNIFERISGEMETPSIHLGSEAVVRDVMSSYFELPANASAVSVYTQAYNGTAFSGSRTPATGVTVTVADGAVEVTGFDYDANFVSDTAKSDGSYGKKLIVEFVTEPKDGFLGGNGVPTNDSSSGVYLPDGGTEKFMGAYPVPTVSVPIPDFTLTAADRNVYLYGSLTEDSLTGAMTVSFGGSPVNCAAWLAGLETWQKAFVTTRFTYDDPTALSAIDSDRSYTATLTLTPTRSGTVTAKAASDSADITVFKPCVTFTDSVADPGTALTAALFESENLVSVAWKHGSVIDSSVTMHTERPALSFTYAPAENTLGMTDVPVRVTAISVGGVSGALSNCSFLWTAASGCSGCTDPNPTDQFRIHPAYASLTIVKTGMQAGEQAIFTVSGAGLGSGLRLIVPGNSGSVTVQGLLVGETYTVTEETGWSWRYVCGSPTGSVTPSYSGENCRLSFSNTTEGSPWLCGETSAHNLFQLFS